eukprot:6384673-Pyramimonas_sp.AAC.1
MGQPPGEYGASRGERVEGGRTPLLVCPHVTSLQMRRTSPSVWDGSPYAQVSCHAINHPTHLLARKNIRCEK